MNEQIAVVPLLRSIGMHPKYKGYAYLVYILSLSKTCPEYVYQLTNKLYPMVMKKFNVSKSSVDRNIGFAIKRTFEEGNRALLSRLFDVYESSYLPTNGEFIAVMTQVLCYCTPEIVRESVRFERNEALEYGRK